MLEGDEAHHALHVVRVRPGDAVALFDGEGQECQGNVAAVARHGVRVEILDRRESSPPAFHVTLLAATLNNQKAIEELIRRCTEVGVSRFVLFPSRHSERRTLRVDKWARIAIEACKQCGRLWLPAFEEADGLESALAMSKGRIYVATQHTAASPIAIDAGASEVSVAVGHEGDFSGDEVDRFLEMGALPLSLGDATYRSEVAAFLASALLLYKLGGLGPRE